MRQPISAVPSRPASPPPASVPLRSPAELRAAVEARLHGRWGEPGSSPWRSLAALAADGYDFSAEALASFERL